MTKILTSSASPTVLCTPIPTPTEGNLEPTSPTSEKEFPGTEDESVPLHSAEPEDDQAESWLDEDQDVHEHRSDQVVQGPEVETVAVKRRGDSEVPTILRESKRRRLDLFTRRKKILPTNSHRPSWRMEDVQKKLSLYDFRRPSWFMEGVVHEPISEVDHFKNQAHITINLDDTGYVDYGTLLYQDLEGRVPKDHKLLTEQDRHNILYGSIDHELETDRAYKLSKKPICNAPAWTKDLPWSEMDGITLEEFIIYFPNHIARWPTLALWLRHQSWDRLFYRTSRLINLARSSHNAENRDYHHIEVLPLMMKIERAIQEIAPHYRLGDHELYDEKPTKEWFLEHIYDKPARFPPNGEAEVVSLEEAAGYITGVNEFQERPFSSRLWQLQPNAQLTDSYVPDVEDQKPKFPFAGAFEDSEDEEANQASRRQQSSQDEQKQEQRQEQRQERSQPWYDVDESSTGWINPDLNMPVTVQGNSIFPRDGQINFAATPVQNAQQAANPSSTPSSPPAVSIFDHCSSFEDCDDIDCYLDHAWDVADREERASRARVKVDTIQIEKVNTICRDHLSCPGGSSCRFLHEGEPGYNQALINQLPRQFGEVEDSHGNDPAHDSQGGQNHAQKGSSNQPRLNTLCRYGTNCNNATCPFAHRSSAAGESITVDPAPSCKFGASCTNSSCNRSHPSPASEQQGQQGRGGGHNGQDQGGGHRGPQRGGGGSSNGSSSGNKNHVRGGGNGNEQGHARNGQGRGGGNPNQARGEQPRGGRGGSNVPQRGAAQHSGQGRGIVGQRPSRGGQYTRGNDRGRGGERGGGRGRST